MWSVAGPPMASMPSISLAPPVASRTRLCRSGPSTSTTSPPSALTPATADSRRTTLMVLKPRSLASWIR